MVDKESPQDLLNTAIALIEEFYSRFPASEKSDDIVQLRTSHEQVDSPEYLNALLSRIYYGTLLENLNTEDLNVLFNILSVVQNFANERSIVEIVVSKIQKELSVHFYIQEIISTILKLCENNDFGHLASTYLYPFVDSATLEKASLDDLETIVCNFQYEILGSEDTSLLKIIEAHLKAIVESDPLYYLKSDISFFLKPLSTEITRRRDQIEG